MCGSPAEFLPNPDKQNQQRREKRMKWWEQDAWRYWMSKKRGRGGGWYSDNSSSDTTNINLLAVTFEINVCVCVCACARFNSLKDAGLHLLCNKQWMGFVPLFFHPSVYLLHLFLCSSPFISSLLQSFSTLFFADHLKTCRRERLQVAMMLSVWRFL